MIFVTVGTSYKFESLIKAIDELAPKLKEKVIIQIGQSNYIPKNCEYFRFVPSLLPYYKKASLVIAHGGAGTTFEVLKLGKKLISVDNPNVDGVHQWDLLKKLSQEKYLLWFKDVTRLNESMVKSKKFNFKKYKSPKCKIHDKIKGFLK